MTKQQWEDKTLQEIKDMGRHISFWWVDDNKFRNSAFNRMLESGHISVNRLDFPTWKITIHKER